MTNICRFCRVPYESTPGRPITGNHRCDNDAQIELMLRHVEAMESIAMWLERIALRDQ